MFLRAFAPGSLAVVSAFAQAQQFEVATLKLSPPPSGDLIDINLGTAQNSKVTLTNATLADCLRFAYGLVSDEQISGPDWIKSRSLRFDVAAQAAYGTPPPELLIMLRNLLAERLKVQVHREFKTLRYLALTSEKNKLRMRTADSSNTLRNPASRGRITSSQMSMARLAGLLSRFEGQVVVDRTGLDGLFEFTLAWTPEGHAADPTGSAPSLFTAVQEQLGLKLEFMKGPLDILVVDRAEKAPTEN